MTNLTRRDALARSCLFSGAGLAAAFLPTAAAGATRTAQGQAPTREKIPLPFRYCLNTSTIRGQDVGIVREMEIAARAGYGGVEPWIDKIEAYVKGGGSLPDLKSRIADLGLTVESVIGFADWINQDETVRAAGLEQLQRDMALVRDIGGTRIAAPPSGGREVKIDLTAVADRYRALLELGEREGVTPQLEVWGFSATIGRLSEAAYVAFASGRREACILPDVYHLYKGGSGFEGLKLLSGLAVHCIHVNDYPADPPRESITDAHRVFPGDGVAPLTQIFRDLHAAGFRGALSLEVFSREYWSRDPLEVAREGLEKTQAAVERALES